MKLKNFIKKRNELRSKKPFLSNTKKRTETRAKKKHEVKKTRRVLYLNILSIALFVIAGVLFAGAYFYNTYLIDTIDGDEVISPGSTHTVHIDEAKAILISKSVGFDSIAYSTTSGVLTLKADETSVYFSQSRDFALQVDVVKRIQRGLQAEGKRARAIDLRYNKPIVKY